MTSEARNSCHGPSNPFPVWSSMTLDNTRSTLLYTNAILENNVQVETQNLYELNVKCLSEVAKIKDPWSYHINVTKPPWF